MLDERWDLSVSVEATTSRLDDKSSCTVSPCGPRAVVAASLGLLHGRASCPDRQEAMPRVGDDGRHDEQRERDQRLGDLVSRDVKHGRRHHDDHDSDRRPCHRPRVNMRESGQGEANCGQELPTHI